MWSLNSPSKSTVCNAYGAEAVPEAQQAAGNMVANGGTALLGGMQKSLECAKGGPAGLEPILLVLTDGQPNEPTTEIISSTVQWNE